jgi:hypothetical protein
VEKYQDLASVDHDLSFTKTFQLIIHQISRLKINIVSDMTASLNKPRNRKRKRNLASNLTSSLLRFRAQSLLHIIFLINHSICVNSVHEDYGQLKHLISLLSTESVNFGFEENVMELRLPCWVCA